MKKDPHIAVIGGGLSGTVLAVELAKRGIRSTVFDTGEHGIGGRLATRDAVEGSLGVKKGSSPPSLVFDHAAQYFTADDPAFQAMVDDWKQRGLVTEWRGKVGTLVPGGDFAPEEDAGPRYVGAGGMRALCEGILAEQVEEGIVEIKRPCWVSDMLSVEDGWKLTGRQKDYLLDKPYDVVVIAHNGKCANRLVSTAGVPAVLRQLRALKLSAIWAGMFAFEEPVAAPGGLEGAFIKGSEVLSWAGNNSAKLGVVHDDNPGRQCWTLFSTGKYGKANKVPQESVPPAKAAEVQAAMLAAFSLAMGGVELPAPSFQRVQLWGAALPINTPRVPCILDAAGRVGVVGDWLTSSSMQAAALSGADMAMRIDGMRGKSAAEAGYLSIGLDAKFTPVGGEDIGSFPSKVPVKAKA